MQDRGEILARPMRRCCETASLRSERILHQMGGGAMEAKRRTLSKPGMEQGWFDLPITDDFMFGEVFSDLGLCRELVETLLDIEVESVEMVERQKDLDVSAGTRAGVLDLLVREPGGRTFDLEMQNKVGPDLAKRSRWYLSLIDTTLLGSGRPFAELGGAVVVFICAHDPLGRGWKRYDFPRLCLQDHEPLGDGSEIVFINAVGVRGEVGHELDAFLAYLRDPGDIASDYVRRVDNAVRGLNQDPLVRRRRMLWSEKYRDELAEAHDEGVAIGEKSGSSKAYEAIAQLYKCLEKDGRESDIPLAMTDPGFRSALMRRYGIDG